jgi:protoheme ferro-lyase
VSPREYPLGKKIIFARITEKAGRKQKIRICWASAKSSVNWTNPSLENLAPSERG